MIVGSGNDRSSGSRAAGEVEYVVLAGDPEMTRVELTIRALLAGPLAQFGRTGIVEDLVARMTGRFATNLEARLSGDVATGDNKPLEVTSLFWSVVTARVRKLLADLFGRAHR